jgi:hypothetical protein
MCTVAFASQVEDVRRGACSLLTAHACLVEHSRWRVLAAKHPDGAWHSFAASMNATAASARAATTKCVL